MTELEHALLALGRDLEVPAAPDLRDAVRARVERRSRRRRILAIAVALVVVAVGIAFVVPPARSAILRFFHIGAATVERVETLPPAQQRGLVSGLGPGRSRAAAERIAGFPMVLPPFQQGRTPTRFYAVPRVIAAPFRYHGKRVLLAELDGQQAFLTKKYASGATTVEPATVSGAYFGLWLSGGPHVVLWSTGTRDRRATTRLAGNVLLWQTATRTYRLEGPLGRDEALRLAHEITP
jgi:hypothetical protein